MALRSATIIHLEQSQHFQLLNNRSTKRAHMRQAFLSIDELETDVKVARKNDCHIPRGGDTVQFLLKGFQIP